jgi:hypothetical protein
VTLFRAGQLRVLVVPGLVLACLSVFFVMPALAQNDCAQGRMDGEAAAKGNAVWILAGFGCGLLGVGAAYLIPPEPPAGDLVGKSPEYVSCYTDAYKSKGRMKNAGNACAGWALAIATVLLISTLGQT